MQHGRRRTGRGYAASLASVLATVVASGLALTACGSEQPLLVNAPTTAPSTVAAAVTAPPASDTATDTPLFVAPSTTAATAAAAAGQTVEVTALPAPAAAALSAPAAAAPTRATASPKAGATSGPRIVPALIPYPATRLAEMAAYSLRHSGSDTARLDPTVIVLHYTAGGTWSSTRDSFAADVANLGELPNVCAHFVVDQDGTVYQLVPTSIRCRHTIGLNDVAIGIEMVQAAGSGPTWADQQILDRPVQVEAALALVRSLQAQYGISTSDVIGHAMANAAPQFRDLQGWHNDHGDWQAADVAVFRSRL